MQVTRHHHVERPWRLYKLHTGGINQLMVNAYFRELTSHLGKHLGVHIAPERLCIALGDQADLCTSTALFGAEKRVTAFWPSSESLLRTPKSVTNQTFGTMTGKHLQLGRHLLCSTPVKATALVNVLPLTVLANNQHVDISSAWISKILRCTRQQPGRALARPQLQALAKGQQWRQRDTVR